MPSNYKQQGDSFLPSPISSKTLDKKDQSRRDMWNIEASRHSCQDLKYK